MKLIEAVSRQKLMPIIFPQSTAQVIEDASIYGEAGFSVVEILCRTSIAIESIREAHRALPHLFIGAGTVLTVELAERAVEAGAQYLVSPAIDPAIIDFAKLRGLQFIPGVCTPTDVAIGLRHGFDLQKFFPAEPSGGVAYMNALASPYGHTSLKLICGAGVVKENYEAYLKHPLCSAIIADWVISLSGKVLREALIETRSMLGLK